MRLKDDQRKRIYDIYVASKSSGKFVRHGKYVIHVKYLLKFIQDEFNVTITDRKYIYRLIQRYERGFIHQSDYGGAIKTAVTAVLNSCVLDITGSSRDLIDFCKSESTILTKACEKRPRAEEKIILHLKKMIKIQKFNQQIPAGRHLDSPGYEIHQNSDWMGFRIGDRNPRRHPLQQQERSLPLIHQPQQLPRSSPLQSRQLLPELNYHHAMKVEGFVLLCYVGNNARKAYDKQMRNMFNAQCTVFDNTIEVPGSELFLLYETPQKEQRGCIYLDTENQFKGVTIYWMHTKDTQKSKLGGRIIISKLFSVFPKAIFSLCSKREVISNITAQTIKIYNFELRI